MTVQAEAKKVIQNPGAKEYIVCTEKNEQCSEFMTGYMKKKKEVTVERQVMVKINVR